MAIAAPLMASLSDSLHVLVLHLRRRVNLGGCHNHVFLKQYTVPTALDEAYPMSPCRSFNSLYVVSISAPCWAYFDTPELVSLLLLPAEQHSPFPSSVVPSHHKITSPPLGCSWYSLGNQPNLTAIYSQNSLHQTSLWQKHAAETHPSTLFVIHWLKFVSKSVSTW